MRTRPTIAVMLLATLGLACAHGPSLRDPQVLIAPARVAGLPTQVNVFVWLKGGVRGYDDDVTGDVQQNVDDSFNYALRQRGGRTFASAGTSRLVHYADFYRWSGLALKQILAELVGDYAAAHHSVTEWRYPGDLTAWRPVLNADFVLVSFFHYGKRVEGSMVADAAGLTGAGSRAIACVVALQSGRVVWCNYIPNNSVAMEERGRAQSAVDYLITGL